MVPRRPDLAEMTVSVSQRSVPRGAALRVTDVVRNAGRTTAPPSTTGYYLSRDRARGHSDVRLGNRQVGALQPGGTSRRSATVRVPSSAVFGFYHVLACADDRHRVRESVELNNCRSSAAELDVTTSNGDHSRPVFAGLESGHDLHPRPDRQGKKLEISSELEAGQR
jgi:subtilase family serine protease